MQTPGTFWEYNDVRINQLSLALLHLFGRALPEVFRESIMQPIGAGTSFTWVEPERRLVLVVRWIDADRADEFFGRVLRAIDKPG